MSVKKKLRSFTITIFRLFLLRVTRYLFYKRLSPTFILGCGHSGTSVVLSILDNHSALHGVSYESKLLYMKETEVYFYAMKWQLAAWMKGKKSWVEKTPKHVKKLSELFQLFPKAKVILMIRDGRDVACSIKARTGDFEAGLNRWVEDNESARQFWNHPNVISIKLEELVADANQTLTQICSFLKITLEVDEMLSFHRKRRDYYKKSSESKGHHESHRNWQINQPLFKDTSRWKKDALIEELALFKSKAQYLMNDLSYLG